MVRFWGADEKWRSSFSCESELRDGFALELGRIGLVGRGLDQFCI